MVVKYNNGDNRYEDVGDIKEITFIKTDEVDDNTPNDVTAGLVAYYTFDNKLITNKNIYLIINCGFIEGEQNITALNIIKRWCDKMTKGRKNMKRVLYTILSILSIICA